MPDFLQVAPTAVIANNAALSAAVDLVGFRLAGIIIPASWTTANITFVTSPDGTNWFDRYDHQGAEYVVTVGGASRSIIVPMVDFLGVRHLKIRSGTTGTPVNQGGERTLTLLAVR